MMFFGRFPFLLSRKTLPFFRSKLSISSIGHEEDVIVTPCIPGEKVCIQCPKGVKDEMYHMYAAVLEEFRVKIPFTPFEMDVLRVGRSSVALRFFVKP